MNDSASYRHRAMKHLAKAERLDEQISAMEAAALIIAPREAAGRMERLSAPPIPADYLASALLRDNFQYRILRIQRDYHLQWFGTLARAARTVREAHTSENAEVR